MRRKQKKGTKGNAAQYLTRTQAVRKLQLRLSDFRRLCILKGVHPREPRKKPKGANKTYYHVKDINFLAHEPLLNTFRSIKAHAKKVKKAKAKQNQALAERLQSLTPTYRVDHLVKERYPSFVDALRDMDDPLTLVHLFATLPAEKKYEIPLEAVQTARRLALEWQAYVVRASALRRVFVSVKGYYFQAEIMGQSVTWLVPHTLSQVLPPDVDYRVMVTFLEFYNTLLQFVNFKLYHTLGLRYPPLLDPKLEEAAAELAGIMKSLAGMRDTAEADRAADSAAALAAVGGSAEDAEAAAAAADPELKARMDSLHSRLREIVGRSDDDGAEAKDNGGSGSADEDEEDEVDSEAGSEDEGDEPLVDIDSGDDDDEEEDDDSEDDDDEELSPALDPRQRSAGKASTRSAPLENDDEDDALQLALSAAGGRAAHDDGDDSDEDDDGAARRRRGGGDSDAGRQAAGGALGAAIDPNDDAAVCGALFRGSIFFLAREVPREPLMFVIRAFGGAVAWEGEGSPYKEADERITHQVVDRPTQGHRFLSREYVQPQWVFDSANFRVLMPLELYAPGKAPPPHLSPFVGEDDDGYTPDFAKTVKRLQDAARSARLRAAGLALTGTGEGGNEFVGEDGGAAGAGGDAGADEDVEEVEAMYRAELAKELKAAAKTKTAGQKRAASEEPSADEDEDDADDDDDSDDDEGEEEDGEEESEEEEEQPAAQKGKGKQGKKLSAAEAEAAEQAAMADIMMTRKAKKMYQGIKAREAAKRQRVEVLEAKKKALEKQQKQPAQAKGTKGGAARKH